MRKTEYEKIERYMLSCMTDSAHDREHIYRVLYYAVDIAKTEAGVNTDILIAACLLHDIGREEQFNDPKVCHAEAGSQKAYAFLVENGWSEQDARHVANCILTHRFRSDRAPESPEAKILFDADKLDVSGTMGIARTLLYQGQISEPLYTVGETGVLDGTNDPAPSFFHEYKFKLETIYNGFYTKRASQLAKSRQSSSAAFYRSLLEEVQSCYDNGQGELSALLD